MILFTLYNRRKRAISPVIAVILLIGLAVAASAAIFLVIMPLFEPTSNLELTDAYVVYDDSYTKTVDIGVGYGKGSVFLSNAGTGKIEVIEINISYKIPSDVDWITITNNVESLQSITPNYPYEINPLAINDELTVRFPIPNANVDDTVAYRMTVTTKDGTTLDTSRITAVDEEEMLLIKDEPDLTPPTSIGTIRRTSTISPISVSDNSEIKNVTYEVSTTSDFTDIVETEIITSPFWRWQWDTRKSSIKGLDNGIYYLKITAHDYAGLSASSEEEIPYFTIDNDYVAPTINYVAQESAWAEVGETFEVTANVVDTGSLVSEVDEVFLHYHLKNETTNTSVKMQEQLGNNYTFPIPIDARALEYDLTYYIEARDNPLDGNRGYFHVPTLEANDTKEPNFELVSMTPEVAVESHDLSISALISDPGLVNTSNVFLYVRQSNDLGANATVHEQPLPTSWVTLFPSDMIVINAITFNITWDIPQAFNNVSIHGLDYYINVTDKYGDNTAQYGTVTIPNHIDVSDLIAPSETSYDGITSNDFPSSWTENTNFPITIEVKDNDPTFGRIVNGDPNTYATGKITIYYKMWDGELDQTFNPSDINQTIHLSGNSSNTEISTWFGVIPKDVIVADTNHRFDFYIELEDQSGSKRKYPSDAPQNFISILVRPSGEPNVEYAEDTPPTLKNNNATVSIKLTNSASGEIDPADATLTEMYLQIFSTSVDFTNGEPNLTKVYFTRFNGNDESYNNTFGTPHPWDGNGTWITFESGVEGLVEDDDGYNFLELTFTNTSGGSFDMHNMILNISFHAKVGANPVDDQNLGTIDTPGDVFIPFAGPLYMQNLWTSINNLDAYRLGFTRTPTSENDLQEASGDLSVTWGIRIFVRSAAGAETSITPSMVATVTRSTAGSGLQSASWNCPSWVLSTTDAIVIRVYVQIGSNSPVIQAEFTTDQLGSTELTSSTWTVHYWTDRTRAGGFWNRRTEATFVWGDATFDSRIENFQYLQPG